jgi:hypothetical protein
MDPNHRTATARTSAHQRMVRRWRSGPSASATDPWTMARHRALGTRCGKPPVFLPIRATDLRPYPPAVCPNRPTGHC